MSRAPTETRRYGPYPVELSSLDKVIYPDAGLTKRDTIDYYGRVADTMLPYLANQACLTPHLWLSRTRSLDHPDRLIFDLDPTEDCDDFAPVVAAAT